MRHFRTGATRDAESGKLDYEGFFSPVVLKRFGEYMHKHRLQSDGNLRDSDNWQKGIPKDVYIKSLFRHFVDLWLHHRGCGQQATHSIEDALCAIIFNASGYLFELLKNDDMTFYPHFCCDCNQSWVSEKREKICKFCKSTNVVNDKDRK